MLVNENGYRGLAVDGQKGLFLVGLYVSAPIFAARYFQPMARPGAELLALMRPASAFEKWLLAWLVVAVAYPVAYHLAFFVCDVPAVAIARGRAAADLVVEMAAKDHNRWLHNWLQPENFQVFLATPRRLGWNLVGAILSITTLQAFAMSGSLLFRRAPFLKTLLAGFLVVLSMLLVVTLMESKPESLFNYWNVGRLTLARGLVHPLAWLVIPSLLWACALLALREREAA
jgi:hypothetical protein